jgi:hydroxymethylglutaryl-CoA reductase (NADPH)
MAATTTNQRVGVPRDRENDYTREAAARRAEFVLERTGASLEHLTSYSFDPAIATGNIEQFVGVAQVPIGLAGPLLVNGEHAQGEFYVPMATAEGTLVASYNRGMRLLYEAGGVTTTILQDHMQRAPAFLFASAREARAFGEWLREHHEEIRAAADRRRVRGSSSGSSSTRPVASSTPASTTQPATRRVRTSQGRRRRQRVGGSSSTIRGSSGISWSRTSPRQVSNLGGFMSGVNNNGAHSANGITAVFIATGQDAANVAESSAAFVYAERRDNGD